MDWTYIGSMFGLAPALLNNATPLMILLLIVAYLIIAPVVFLVLLKKYFRIDLESSLNWNGFKRFLILAFVLQTGTFVAGLFVTIFTGTVIAIPSLIIGYFIGLIIYAGILWVADRIGEAVGWL